MPQQRDLRGARARRRRLAVQEESENGNVETLSQALGGLTSDAKSERQFNYAWKDAIVESFHLTPAEKHVSSAIASFINMDPDHPWYGTGWASQKTIADRLKLTVRTVNSAFGKLRSLGLIVVEEGAGWKYPGARTATHRFALSSRGLFKLRSIDNFERQLLAAYAYCGDAHGSGRSPTVWKRPPTRGEIKAGKTGNPWPEDKKLLLTSDLCTFHDVDTSPTIVLDVEYRVLCILVGVEGGEEYGRNRLARLSPILLRRYIGGLVDGSFTMRSLREVIACVAQPTCSGATVG